MGILRINSVSDLPGFADRPWGNPGGDRSKVLDAEWEVWGCGFV